MIVFIKTFITFILIYAFIMSIHYSCLTNISTHLKVLCIGFSISLFVALMYELFTY